MQTRRRLRIKPESLQSHRSIIALDLSIIITLVHALSICLLCVSLPLYAILHQRDAAIECCSCVRTNLTNAAGGIVRSSPRAAVEIFVIYYAQAYLRDSVQRGHGTRDRDTLFVGDGKRRVHSCQQLLYDKS